MLVVSVRGALSGIDGPGPPNRVAVTSEQPPHGTLDVCVTTGPDLVFVKPVSSVGLTKMVVGHAALAASPASAGTGMAARGCSWLYAVVGEHSVTYSVVGVATLVEVVMRLSGQKRCGVVCTCTSMQPLQSTSWLSVRVDG